MKEVLTNMKTLHFNGKLTLSDSIQDENRMNYIIEDKISNEKHSITDILEEIFNRDASVSKLVRVIGRINSNGHSFNGMGNLHMCFDKSRVQGYCIGSMQFELQLFELVDCEIEIILEDYTTFETVEGIQNNEDAKSKAN